MECESENEWNEMNESLSDNKVKTVHYLTYGMKKWQSEQKITHIKKHHNSIEFHSTSIRL